MHSGLAGDTVKDTAISNPSSTPCVDFICLCRSAEGCGGHGGGERHSGLRHLLPGYGGHAAGPPHLRQCRRLRLHDHRCVDNYLNVNGHRDASKDVSDGSVETSQQPPVIPGPLITGGLHTSSLWDGARSGRQLVAILSQVAALSICSCFTAACLETCTCENGHMAAAGSSHKNRKTHIKYQSPQQEHTFGFPYQVSPEAFAATDRCCQAFCVRLDTQCNAQVPAACLLGPVRST